MVGMTGEARLSGEAALIQLRAKLAGEAKWAIRLKGAIYHIQFRFQGAEKAPGHDNGKITGSIIDEWSFPATISVEPFMGEITASRAKA